jgi:dimethylglycine dehydrogenase
MAHARSRYLGLDTELLSAAEAKKLFPLLEDKYFVGAMLDAADGNLDPSGTTHAYAKSARIAGAEIYLQTRVTDLTPRPDGTWTVVTDKGTLHAEHVVNCGGLWAREIGRMVGLELPVLAMEHMYLVTEDMPEVVAFNKETGHELPHAIDFKAEIYMRQERSGMVLGTYEKACVPWQPRQTPWDFGTELLPPDLDRIAPSLEIGFQHFPAMAKAGIKRVINGPFTFSPDGNPLVGPVPGLRNYWSACAVMAGFSQGGGVGLILAEWMIHGEPSRDVFAMDVARYGDWISPGYTRAKVRENYQRRFSVGYPNEELPAARPYQTTPAYGIWKAQRAVFGAAYGMEAVNYFAPEGEPLFETPSFRRSNAFEATAQECRAVREAVGINEIHNFGKYEVTGPGALNWLDHIMAGRIPRIGRLSLTPMLSPKGVLIGDFTISRLGEESFQLTASFGAQAFHMRWFEQNLPEDGVSIRNVSTKRIGFQIAGPKARELLSRVAMADVSNEALPFTAVQNMDIGLCRATVQRVSYTGDLGYEIYVDAEDQISLYHTLSEAGADLGLRPFGMRAMMSLRLEKGFGSWMREFKPDYTPLETGMGRFVSYNKPADFIGKAAALADKAQSAKRQLCTFIVQATDADTWGDEPIWHDGKVVGFVTSGGYAHHAQKSVALGFLPVELIEEGREVEIEILGELCKAHLITEPLFDPGAERMRG